MHALIEQKRKVLYELQAGKNLANPQLVNQVNVRVQSMKSFKIHLLLQAMNWDPLQQSKKFLPFPHHPT